MNDTERAKSILLAKNGNYTCVLCRGEETLTATQKGIAPMMDFLDSGADLHGFCAADRIVGKAAALLFVLAGVRDVYAEVITEEAIAILKNAEIGVSFDVRTAHIINRAGTGLCPMELAVQDVDDPEKGRCEIRRALQRLAKNNA